MADYYPRIDGSKLLFLENFSTQAALHGATVGLSAGDLTAISSAHTDLETAITDKIAAKAASQSLVAACRTVDEATEETIRAHVRRIKAHAGYTPAIGEALGIETGPSAPPDELTPVLEVVSAFNGEVTIAFQKRGMAGVEIKSKRGAATEVTFLARDTESPYIDTRPNLTAGPETRYYQAQYLNKDHAVGALSDLLVVTVPGLA